MLTLQKMPRNLIMQRNSLLQDSLRPGFHDYSIADEYPIVLNPDFGNFSYCALTPHENGKPQTLLAHASLWPRTLLCHDTGKSGSIGLVGNVATLKSVRGTGIMKRLLSYLWDQARENNLQALVLWSDLKSFYQKMGFQEQGQELRLFMYRKTLEKRRPAPEQVKVTASDPLSLPQMTYLLKLRFQTRASIGRSPGEFKTLLRIPDTLLLIQGDWPSPTGYLILGKGFDMPGVIHEWGAREPSVILNMIRHILITTGWEYLMLLSPPLSQNSLWAQELSASSDRTENHPLGYIRTQENSKIGKLFHKAFLWGLDTI